VLFNCAGFVHSGTILQTGKKRLRFLLLAEREIGVNRMIREFLPGCSLGAAARSSNVIRGQFRDRVSNRFVYGASKAAVIGLTKSVAQDFVQRGCPLQR